jgi:hypothetical protein
MQHDGVLPCMKTHKQVSHLRLSVYLHLRNESLVIFLYAYVIVVYFLVGKWPTDIINAHSLKDSGDVISPMKFQMMII